MSSHFSQILSPLNNHSSNQVFSFSSQSKAEFAKKLKNEPLINSNLVTMQQVHGAKIHFVESALPQSVIETDAILTTLPHTALVVRAADCLPILLYQEKTGLIGAIHAGRKSTQLQIVNKVIKLIQKKFGTSQGLQIWFGPAICNNCYQIDAIKDLYFDLIAENKKQIPSALTKTTALSVANTCTRCSSQGWQSYRRSGIGTDMNYFCIIKK